MADQVKVGLIGCGTVGSSVARFFAAGGGTPQRIRLERIAVSDLSKPRPVEADLLTDDVEEVLSNPEIDIVIEVMGGEERALQFLSRAIENGKSVVTANKVVIARHMKQLFERARRHGVDIGFEASVAGGIPILQILRSYGGEEISRVTGILNGTSNFILSRMEEGMDFSAALKIAQEKGFAEAEHLLDTGGFDSRDKLAIIASLVYDTSVDPNDIYCEGITGITPIDLDFAAKYGVEEGAAGYAVKSLATARLSVEGLALHVYPALIPKQHPLGSVRDEVNAIYLEGKRCGPQLFQGRGAGGEATSSAVISDVIRLALNRRKQVTDDLPRLEGEVPLAAIEKLEKRGYVRMNLKHLPGSIAEASRIMGEFGFNIEDSVQRRRFKTEIEGAIVIPDVVTVESLPFEVVSGALTALERSNRVYGNPFYLRFED